MKTQSYKPHKSPTPQFTSKQKSKQHSSIAWKSCSRIFTSPLTSQKPFLLKLQSLSKQKVNPKVKFSHLTLSKCSIHYEERI